MGRDGKPERPPLVITPEFKTGYSLSKARSKNPAPLNPTADDKEYLRNMWLAFSQPIEDDMYVGEVETVTKKFRYTPRQMWDNIKHYFDATIERGQPLTLSGAAAFCGIKSADLFYEIDKMPEPYHFLNRVRQFIEMYNEYAMHKKQNPAGPIFALKNFGWKDKFEIEASSTQGALTEAERSEMQKRLTGFSEGLKHGTTLPAEIVG